MHWMQDERLSTMMSGHYTLVAGGMRVDHSQRLYQALVTSPWAFLF